MMHSGLSRVSSFEKVIHGRLQQDDDLYLSLTSLARDHKLTSALVLGIGAVKCAHLAYYNQAEKCYEGKYFEGGMEIVSFSGNIALKDSLAFLHCHLVLADHHFNTIGGHLLEGTKVFAFEYQFLSFGGNGFRREYDGKAGLYLLEYNL